jgi:glycosyltransferase involved in cell wall biosynthesis
MKISIVTPVLNGARFIRKTIESVLSQKGDFEIEYIIKDGGSTDQTLAILDEFQQCPSLHVIPQKDDGLYDAINQGFKHATGDIGCWINADDYYEPGAFQTVVDAFQTHPDQQWLFGDCDIVNASSKEIRKFITWYKGVLAALGSYHILTCENYVNQPACFWRMRLWQCVGGLDATYKYAADYALWLNMATCAGMPMRIQHTLAHFRRCGDSLSDTQFTQQFQEELYIAKQFCCPMAYAIHRFNTFKIISVYKLLNFLA